MTDIDKYSQLEIYSNQARVPEGEFLYACSNVLQPLNYHQRTIGVLLAFELALSNHMSPSHSEDSLHRPLGAVRLRLKLHQKVSVCLMFLL